MQQLPLQMGQIPQDMVQGFLKHLSQQQLERDQGSAWQLL